jgi:hypothetical protein
VGKVKFVAGSDQVARRKICLARRKICLAQAQIYFDRLKINLAAPDRPPGAARE